MKTYAAMFWHSVFESAKNKGRDGVVSTPEGGRVTTEGGDSRTAELCYRLRCRVGVVSYGVGYGSGVCGCQLRVWRVRLSATGLAYAVVGYGSGVCGCRLRVWRARLSPATVGYAEGVR